jgi:hypothetical protein
MPSGKLLLFAMEIIILNRQFIELNVPFSPSFRSYVTFTDGRYLMIHDHLKRNTTNPMIVLATEDVPSPP